MPFGGPQEEMRNPALIFSATLMRPVDTAHSENVRRQPEETSVVQGILIGGSF